MSRRRVAVGELGSNVDNFDEVVSDVAVEANKVPPCAGAVAGNAGEACRLPLWILRARAHEDPIEATLIQLCDVGHEVRFVNFVPPIVRGSHHHKRRCSSMGRERDSSGCCAMLR